MTPARRRGPDRRGDFAPLSLLQALELQTGPGRDGWRQFADEATARERWEAERGPLVVMEPMMATSWAADHWGLEG